MDDFILWIEEILKVKPGSLSLQTKREDIDSWDSLMQMRLIMEVEEKYGVEILFEEIEGIDSVEKLWSYAKK